MALHKACDHTCRERERERERERAEVGSLYSHVCVCRREVSERGGGADDTDDAL
jgi:hypothetical protein